ncbi:hypothetical protein GOBAR_AA29704 [Gossypium barbadense]|uniref:Peptidase S54 rhomboid domain-containing protein n=1 Tax=Gossypium barbadense TaxID=3634 RepID=A0A2P5WIQ0_GOSBA|nr:hypothetical protein GOBAR_AA29704 [Gossypium barbadense]
MAELERTRTKVWRLELRLISGMVPMKISLRGKSDNHGILLILVCGEQINDCVCAYTNSSRQGPDETRKAHSVQGIQSLYLYHNWPAWYQFITSTFCHANWKHLSSNLFFLYIFGKLVEEEEGSFALWLSYIFTGAGANIVSWLVLPRNAVSVGASGAVFGLFAISVLVKMSWDWRKILEVLILGQFVIDKVMEAAQASTGLSGFSYPLQNVNHIAHLSGALIGVLLVWLLSKIPSEPLDNEISKSPRKRS